MSSFLFHASTQCPEIRKEGQVLPGTTGSIRPPVKRERVSTWFSFFSSVRLGQGEREPRAVEERGGNRRFGKKRRLDLWTPSGKKKNHRQKALVFIAFISSPACPYLFVLFFFNCLGKKGKSIMLWNKGLAAIQRKDYDRERKKSARAVLAKRQRDEGEEQRNQ